MGVKIKICGLKSVADAEVAAACGADFAGVVFHEKSPRKVSVEAARRIAMASRAASAKPIKLVGVFTRGDYSFIRQTMREADLDIAQLHFDASDDLVERLMKDWRVWRAFWLSCEADVEAALSSKADAVLLDSRNSILPGGTGELSNWELAAEVARKRKVVLAGGISAENALEAVSAVGPWAIDANSGVEVAPGQKDPLKIRKLLSLKL